MEQTDVVVIGGGIAGVSSAAHLAAAGWRVILLERDHLGAGASGRNSGVVQYPFDPVLADLHLETVVRYRELAERSGGIFRLPAVPAGLLSVTHDVGLARALATSLAASHPALQPAFLDPSAARRAEPSLAPGVAAVRLEIGYPVAPAAATNGYAAWARSLGVDVREGVRAALLVAGDRVRGVRLGDGTTIGAETVIVAAGPWTPGIVDPGGTWRPIGSLWGVVVATVLERPPRFVLEEAEIDIEPSAAADTTGDRAFSLITAEGASSVGSTFLDHEPDGPALAPDILARGATFVPELARAPLGAVRTCARPLSADGRPLIGRVPWLDGLWVVAGHGPWGISTGPASGRLLADLVSDAIAAPPPALDPARFGGSPSG